MAVVIWFHQSGFLASSGEYGTILGAILSLGKIAVVMAVPFVLSLVVLSTVVRKTVDLQRRAFEKERAKRYAAVAETVRVRAEQVARREEARKREADLKQARAVITDRVAERDAERELEKKLEAAARTAKRRDAVVWGIAVVIAVLNVTGKGITSQQR
jgi:choline-glycine betaine transporter